MYFAHDLTFLQQPALTIFFLFRAGIAKSVSQVTKQSFPEQSEIINYGCFLLPFGVFVHTMKLYIGRRCNASCNRKLGTRIEMNEHFNAMLSLSAQKYPL
jgi:hypothetical protein